MTDVPFVLIKFHSVDDHIVQIGNKMITVAATFCRLESPTSKMFLSGTKGIYVRAPAGAISIYSLTDFTIQSKNKAVSNDIDN